MNSLYDYFNSQIDTTKLSHSFLIGNVCFDEIKDDLYKVFNKFIFNNIENIETNPDIYIIKPVKDNIPKESIKELISDVSTTSQFNNNKVYVIDYAEKLNDYSYNAILKTLEEPSPNVYAFLLTTNMELIKPTIVSRCQKIFLSSEFTDNNYDENTIEAGNKLIEYIEKDNYKIICNHPEIYNIIDTREALSNVLKYMLNEFFKELNNIIYEKDSSSIIVKNNDIDNLSKKIIIINERLNSNKYNLNKNLVIDRLIIDMWRC